MSVADSWCSVEKLERPLFSRTRPIFVSELLRSWLLLPSRNSLPNFGMCCSNTIPISSSFYFLFWFDILSSHHMCQRLWVTFHCRRGSCHPRARREPHAQAVPLRMKQTLQLTMTEPQRGVWHRGHPSISKNIMTPESPSLLPSRLTPVPFSGTGRPSTLGGAAQAGVRAVTQTPWPLWESAG